jgi:hypothetical protein
VFLTSVRFSRFGVVQGPHFRPGTWNTLVARAWFGFRLTRRLSGNVSRSLTRVEWPSPYAGTTSCAIERLLTCRSLRLGANISLDECSGIPYDREGQTVRQGSTNDQNREMQLRELRDYAAVRKWTVHGEYVDTGGNESGLRDCILFRHPSAESPRGISPRGAHRSGREPLDSSGSCHPVKAAAFRRNRRVPPVAR